MHACVLFCVCDSCIMTACILPCLVGGRYLIQETHQLPTGKLEHVLQSMGEDVDMDEIECILVNLIFQGRIKGYLSHEKRVLVVSKKDQFTTSAAIVRS